MDLRRLLQRLLPGLGALVALSALALGASRVLMASVPGAAVFRPDIVLIFGACASLTVRVVYVPAASTLRRRALGLAEELVALRAAETVEEVAIRAERDCPAEVAHDVQLSIRRIRRGRRNGSRQGPVRPSPARRP